MKRISILILSLGLFYGCGTTKDTTTNNLEVQPLSQVVDVPTLSEEEEVIIDRPRYNPSATVFTDLIHTKLEVDFNWEKSQLNGIATLTVSPRFYATDSLILDAKAMEILSVSLNEKRLNYKYNDANYLRIKLDRKYTKDEKYTVVIKYIAKPEEKEKGGSRAITSDKGLYFINPRGENENQMPQIWTQGETESNSVWFPTFDRPNYKSTQEVFITVENKYTTLSNGKLISSKTNGNGTRTDYWKQDLPHAPYLFMIAVGEFSIVEDSYTKADGTVIPVNYYVEPEWAEHAKAIFGQTPKMMKFFSDVLGVEYPWDKYHQIVVREYVSGAMENTTASVFGDFVYKTKRELLDSDDQSVIAHELIHQWFGDLVTLESWANLPLNESFANYSQYLWDEFHNGRDEADFNAEKEENGYYQSARIGGSHDMIWYDYFDKDDMFDAHAYNKGGRILHTLRYYLGDEAFFTGLKLYLNTHAFKTVELADLRMAFEEVTGEDLNWFFNQWFFASYHPKLKTTQTIDDNKVTLKIEQTQDLEEVPLYKLPMKIAVYTSEGKTTHNVTVDKNINYFTFSFTGKLENIIVDEDRAILGEFTHVKPREWYIHQYYNAPRYTDRKEALIYGTRSVAPEAKQMILDALNDRFWNIRQFAISKLDKIGQDKQLEAFNQLKKIAIKDKNSKVRNTAIMTLSAQFFKGEFENETRDVLINTIEKDSSYLVISSALNGLTKGNDNDLKKALSLAKKLESERSSSLKSKIIEIYKNYGDKSNLDFMAKTISNGEVYGYDIIGSLMSFSFLLEEQDLETKDKYLYVFEDLSNSSDAYVSAILPAVLVNLIRSLFIETDGLEESITSLKEKGATAEVEKVQKKLDSTKKLQEKFSLILDKANE